MIRLACKRILLRKAVSAALIIALLSIFILIPLGIQNTKSAALVTELSIEKYGRGSYDILVRPSGSRTAIEQETGMVEENYIGDSQGGISIAEWKNIQNDRDIEAAAPVSSIGYFTGKKFSVELPAIKDTAAFSWTFHTSDGNKEYALGKPRHLVYFKESQPGFIQYVRDSELGESASGAMMEIMMPPAYYQLAAIDIDSEEKITNLDLSELRKELPKEEREALESFFAGVPIIKVIQRKDINIPLKLTLTVSNLDVNIAEVQNKLGISEGEWLMSADKAKIDRVLKDLKEIEPAASKKYEYDLTAHQKPFNGTALQINEQFQVVDAINFVSDRTQSTLYYTASKLDYRNDGGILGVKILEEGSPPSYKELTEKGKKLWEFKKVPYLMEQVGTFSAAALNNSPLASSPLGIYSTSGIKTGDGRVLTPTTVPGSFIPQPAGGLVTIESAEMIKGPKPIDAIRIRVGGIEAYNEEAQQKIERVATKLLQQGYEVDIVAGSSFKTVKLNVEGVGMVDSPWTTLGTAQSLGESWNIVGIVTTVLFSSFAFIWLMIRFTFERNVLEKENALLAVVGWSTKRIVRRNQTEQFLLLGIAYVLSVPIIELLALDRTAYLYTTVFFILAALLISFLLGRAPAGKQQLASKKRFQSLSYYWKLILPTILVLIMSTLLLAIQVSSLGSVFASAADTTLGQFIMNETRWFQYAIMGSTLILSVISLSESVNALMSARDEEFRMYKVIGWSRVRVFLHVLKEASVWLGAALAAGMAASFFIQYMISIPWLWSLYGTVFTALVFGCMAVLLLFSRLSYR